MFVAIGHDARSELVRGQVDTDDAGYVLTDAPGTRTNIPGVFACGDLVDHTYPQGTTHPATPPPPRGPAPPPRSTPSAASPRAPSSPSSPAVVTAPPPKRSRPPS